MRKELWVTVTIREAKMEGLYMRVEHTFSLPSGMYKRDAEKAIYEAMQAVANVLLERGGKSAR